MSFTDKVFPKFWGTVILSSTCMLGAFQLQAQRAALRFATPERDSMVTHRQKITFSGLAQPTGKLWINGKSVKVYSTGAFAILGDSLVMGTNDIPVLYVYKKDTIRKTFYITREEITNPAVTGIASIKIYPENTEWVQPGDRLQLRVQAASGMQVTCLNTVLQEEDSTQTGRAGIYTGTYTFTEKDTGRLFPIEARLYDPIGKNTLYKTEGHTIKVLSGKPLTGYSIGKLPFLTYGYGDDRLGGAKMSYIDSLIPFAITGKINNLYRVQLTKEQSAYIPADNILLTHTSALPPATVLSGNWRVMPVTGGDQIRIELESRRPFSSITEINPTRIMVDLYGTVSNTNWITKLQGLKVIRNVWYEQLPGDIMRVFIDLKTPQIWGYDIHYEGNTLLVFVKSAPKSTDWKDLIIAIDAGHGGSNLGADGLTGVLEKDITLQVASKMEKQLKLLGAHVVMTRTHDTSLSMPERILFLKEAKPDLLVSFHCNSSGPMVQGNSTYYRYIGFAPLSEYIHREMLDLGLEDYGNIGSFNFALSGPTQYVNALNEMAFISNPEDEAKLLDPIWQNKIVKATIEGIRRFLVNSIKPPVNQ